MARDRGIGKTMQRCLRRPTTFDAAAVGDDL